MKIEIEMTSESTDVSEILPNLAELVNSAKGQGFVIKELEIESDDDNDEDEEE